MTTDVPLNDAMLCWNSGLHGDAPGFMVVHHPDTKGISEDYSATVGACFSNWRTKTPEQQRLQLMVDAWHIAAFYAVPIEDVHMGLMVIPEYRDMLAGDCLPAAFQHERN